MPAHFVVLLVLFVFFLAMTVPMAFLHLRSLRVDPRRWRDFAPSHGLAFAFPAPPHLAALTGCWHGVRVEASLDHGNDGPSTHVRAFFETPLVAPDTLRIARKAGSGSGSALESIDAPPGLMEELASRPTAWQAIHRFVGMQRGTEIVREGALIRVRGFVDNVTDLETLLDIVAEAVSGIERLVPPWAVPGSPKAVLLAELANAVLPPGRRRVVLEALRDIPLNLEIRVIRVSWTPAGEQPGDLDQGYSVIGEIPPGIPATVLFPVHRDDEVRGWAVGESHALTARVLGWDSYKESLVLALA